MSNGFISSLYMERNLILAVNPGSTSTKFALFKGEELLFEMTLRHTSEEIGRFDKMTDQFSFRKNMIVDAINKAGFDMRSINAVVGRGGLVNPIESGIYGVNDLMLKHLSEAVNGEHASNLGALIADDIVREFPEVKAYIVDPVVVDEMEPVARLSGHPLISRRSIFHALNQKAMARIYAASVGKKYEDLNLVVVHMGGGISVGAHLKGRVIDVNNALNGDGPYSPERSGGLPVQQFADICFSGKFTSKEIKSLIAGKGGMVAYLGTNDFRDVCEKAGKGDSYAELIQTGAAYQVSKEIGAMVAVLHGNVDAIILTGGLAYQKTHVDKIIEMVSSFAPVAVYPGEDELKALAYNGLLAISGKIEVKTYKG